MKKLSVSLFAVLAIALATASAFTTKGSVSYLANTDRSSGNPPTYEQDVTLAVNQVGETTYRAQHCDPSSTIICFAKFQDGTPISTFTGLYK